MQTQILTFLMEAATPFWDFIAHAASFLGETEIVFAIVAFLVWNTQRRKSFALCMNLVIALSTTGILKALVRAPRPFTVLEHIGAKRISTATGYSFPSGHTTTAAAFYGSLAILWKKRPLSIAAAFIILAVGISRLYLGVHWPIDVFAGLLVGTGLSFLLSPIMMRLFDNKGLSIRLAVWVGGTVSLLSAVMAVMVAGGLADSVAFSDMVKVVGVTGGAMLGYGWERAKVDYHTDCSWTIKLIRYCIGAAMIGAIMALKAVLPLSAVSDWLRYFAVGLWLMGIYPVLGSRIKLGGSPLFSGSDGDLTE